MLFIMYKVSTVCLLDFLFIQVRGALETLVSALTPINRAKGSSNEVQPDLMNTDLLSREAGSISLLLSLLVRIYFLKSWGVF